MFFAVKGGHLAQAMWLARQMPTDSVMFGKDFAGLYLNDPRLVDHTKDLPASPVLYALVVNNPQIAVAMLPFCAPNDYSWVSPLPPHVMMPLVRQHIASVKRSPTRPRDWLAIRCLRVWMAEHANPCTSVL